VNVNTYVQRLFKSLKDRDNIKRGSSRVNFSFSTFKKGTENMEGMSNGKQVSFITEVKAITKDETNIKVTQKILIPSAALQPFGREHRIIA